MNFSLGQIVSLANIGSGLDFKAGIDAIRKDDIEGIFELDVKPILSVVALLDPAISPEISLAIIGIELLLALHNKGMLPIPPIHGADAQEPEMLARAGQPGTANI